ncbi:MAG: hypothetical protein Q9218_007156, partial [Villophora microphyllina]
MTSAAAAASTTEPFVLPSIPDSSSPSITSYGATVSMTGWPPSSEVIIVEATEPTSPATTILSPSSYGTTIIESTYSPDNVDPTASAMAMSSPSNSTLSATISQVVHLSIPSGDGSTPYTIPPVPTSSGAEAWAEPLPVAVVTQLEAVIKDAGVPAGGKERVLSTITTIARPADVTASPFTDGGNRGIPGWGGKRQEREMERNTRRNRHPEEWDTDAVEKLKLMASTAGSS